MLFFYRSPNKLCFAFAHHCADNCQSCSAQYGTDQQDDPGEAITAGSIKNGTHKRRCHGSTQCGIHGKNTEN